MTPEERVRDRFYGDKDFDGQIFGEVTVDEIAELIRAAENEALERAALRCEDEKGDSKFPDFNGGWDTACEKLPEYIRALKHPTSS